MVSKWVGHRLLLNSGLVLAIVLALPRVLEAADIGETIPTPVDLITYELKPGRMTGEEFFFEKNLFKKIQFDDQLLSYIKPKGTVTLSFSLRGVFRSQDIFGHGDFTLNGSKDVATGWVPVNSGRFLIFPDKSKEHLPRFIPERTKLVRVPLIAKYDNKAVNAYDLIIALDRGNQGGAESIPFRIVPSTTNKDGVYLIPNQDLPVGVYYAYSTSDDTEKFAGMVHGFLFAVGNPISEVQPTVTNPTVQQNPFLPKESSISAWKPESTVVDSALAKKVLDYALLSDAAYSDRAYDINGWKPITPIKRIKFLFDLSDNSAIDIRFPNSMDTTVAGSTPSTLKTGFSARAFQRDNQVIIAFRGTQLDDWDDIKTDVENFLGGNPQQYQDAIDFVDTFQQNCPSGVDKDKIILVGHSLGGGLASYVALKNQLFAWVFNAAGLGTGLRVKIGENIDLQNMVRNIDVDGDPVSDLCNKQGSKGSQIGMIYTLPIPKSWIGRGEWIDARSQVAVAAAALDPNIVGDPKPMNPNPLAYHSMETVTNALNALIK